MKTHKVIDITENEAVVFYGTEEDCYEWKKDQGFGYSVVPLGLEEKEVANSL